MNDPVEFPCPYCSSLNSSLVDITEGRMQEWITDCEVCCRPLVVQLKIVNGHVESCSVRKENE